MVSVLITFSDLSRSQHSSTLNNSKVVQVTANRTIVDQQKSVINQMVPLFSMNLNDP